MDVFKDLIDELKEENLLEHTVIDADEENELIEDNTEPPNREKAAVLSPSAGAAEEYSFEEGREADDLNTIDAAHDASIADSDGFVNVQAFAEPSRNAAAEPVNGVEFYKKRAINEMSSLQMVEHVLTGVEREYVRIVPKTFDDFAAKKALNAFLQNSDDETSSRKSEAEFAMMEETEAWCSALAERDRAIPVSNLRQFCENSRPSLSSQALVALARFYRNLPYSETVRAKFDFVITRLFTRQAPGNKRICLFSREEMLNHISLLYKEWSSVPLYTAEDDESKVLLTALSFEELANEAESASSFDFLIANDFFGRLGMFKESVSELFFAPNVTAAAIDCNVRVGNAYVTLIDSARVKMDSQSMFSKFGTVDSLVISDAAARSLEIVEILRQQRDLSRHNNDEKIKADAELLEKKEKQVSGETFDVFSALSGAEASHRLSFLGIKDRLVESVRSANRWLIISSAIVIAISIGIFTWTTVFMKQPEPDTSARSIELPNSVLRKHLKTARVSGDNFYGLLLPSWEALSKEKREEYLKIIFDYAQELGCTQVSLLDSTGKAAGFASLTKTEVIMQ